MSNKRILIVDDDKSILRMLEFGLKKLGPDYQFFTAKDISIAMEFIEDQWFDLIITDYMMPGMTGVDLARAVRRISPDTQVVLMTAYGSSELRNTTDNLGIDGFLNKPFTMEQIREVVIQTTGRTDEPQEDLEPTTSDDEIPSVTLDVLSAENNKSIDGHLKKLQVDAGTRGVILVSADGQPVQIVGQIDNKKSEHICSLVTANFYSPAELSKLLNNKNAFKASFYEGDSYNLYVCDVNGKYLLAVVFDANLRPGVVWFYTRQTAAALIPLLNNN